MPNGTAALHLVPAPASPAANDQEDIKVELGRLMADAVAALGAGLADLDAGGLTDTNRARGGETIAAVVELQLAHFGAFDFGALALAEGKRILHARHGATLRQQLGSDAGIDDTFDMLLSHVLAVATKVSAIEAVYRSN
jgi:hypothetical protein